MNYAERQVRVPLCKVT